MVQYELVLVTIRHKVLVWLCKVLIAAQTCVCLYCHYATYQALALWGRNVLSVDVAHVCARVFVCVCVCLLSLFVFLSRWVVTVKLSSQSFGSSHQPVIFRRNTIPSDALIPSFLSSPPFPTLNLLTSSPSSLPPSLPPSLPSFQSPFFCWHCQLSAEVAETQSTQQWLC